jgi:hypothetical protein
MRGLFRLFEKELANSLEFDRAPCGFCGARGGRGERKPIPGRLNAPESERGDGFRIVVITCLYRLEIDPLFPKCGEQKG